MRTEFKLESVGTVVREFRERSGLSLRALAERLKWDRGRLSKYENDQLGLSFSSIEAIAKALGIDPIVIVLKCLECRYPRLSSQESSIGNTLRALVDAVQENT